MIDKIKIIITIVTAVVIITLYSQLRKAKSMLSIAKQNETTLLSKQKDIIANGEKIGIENGTLRLTISEFKDLRNEDVKLIKNLNVKIKNLESYSKTQIKVNSELRAILKDTTLIERDPITQVIIKESKFKSININKPDMQMSGIITDSEFIGKISLPATIYQTIEAEYRRKFLWWRWGLKGFRQTVTTNNKNIDIEYAEFVNVGKTKRRKR